MQRWRPSGALMFADPDDSPILHQNKPEARANLERLRGLRADHPDVLLVNAHDASLLDALPAFPEPVA